MAHTVPRNLQKDTIMDNPIIISADNTPEPEREPYFRYSTERGLFEYVYSNDEVSYTVKPENAAEALTNFYRDQARLVAEISKLRDEQISGDDDRLADFWAKAQELADKAGHCQVFDEMAVALGGPGRQRDYTVDIEFPVTVMARFSYTVTARNDADAQDDALEMARQEARYNLTDYVDLDEADIEFSEATIDSYEA